MDISIECAPSYSMAYVSLLADEAIIVEHGAMAAMSEGIAVQGALAGGIVKSGLRRALGGESLFMGVYRAEDHGAWVAIAPPFPGDMTVIDMTHDHPMICETGAVVGHAESVEVDVRYAGVKNIILREGATTLRMSGEGKTILSSYGGIQRFSLEPGQSMIIDTGHLVAWSQSIDVRIGMLGGAVNSALTGEGLVAKLTGPGVIYMQTRAESELRSWLLPNRAQNTGRMGGRK